MAKSHESEITEDLSTSNEAVAVPTPLPLVIHDVTHNIDEVVAVPELKTAADAFPGELVNEPWK